MSKSFVYGSRKRARKGSHSSFLMPLTQRLPNPTFPKPKFPKIPSFSHNFDFFNFWQIFFVCPPNNFGRGAKKSKNRFLPIFSPFQAILNNFEFFSLLTKKNCGGYPKFMFTIFHLVRHNRMYTQHFRPLWPFLVVFLWWKKQQQLLLFLIATLASARSWAESG